MTTETASLLPWDILLSVTVPSMSLRRTTLHRPPTTTAEWPHMLSGGCREEGWTFHGGAQFRHSVVRLPPMLQDGKFSGTGSISHCAEAIQQQVAMCRSAGFGHRVPVCMDSAGSATGIFQPFVGLRTLGFFGGAGGSSTGCCQSFLDFEEVLLISEVGIRAPVGGLWMLTTACLPPSRTACLRRIRPTATTLGRS